MFHYLKLLLILSVILLTSWYFTRDYLPAIVTQSSIGRMLNKVVSSVVSDVSDLSKKLKPGDYYDKIKVVRAEQFKNIIKTGIQKNAVMLIYIYSLNGQISSVNFRHIVDIARDNPTSDLKVITLALEENKDKLAKFINKFGDAIGFTPFQLAPSDTRIFSSTIRKVLTGYGTSPYLIVTNRNGVAIYIPPGLSKETKIINAVANALSK